MKGTTSDHEPKSLNLAGSSSVTCRPESSQTHISSSCQLLGEVVGESWGSPAMARTQARLSVPVKEQALGIFISSVPTELLHSHPYHPAVYPECWGVFSLPRNHLAANCPCLFI